MKVEGSDGGSWLGVLQPVTSLVSTLSLLKPQHHSQLLNKLINPPSTSSSKESAKTTNSTSAKFVPVPLKSKRQLPPRRCRTASQVLRDVSQPSALQHESGVPSRVLSEKEKLGLSADGAREERKASSMEESEGCPWGSGIMAGCASDSELYAGLQLLFRQSKPDKSMHTLA